MSGSYYPIVLMTIARCDDCSPPTRFDGTKASTLAFGAAHNTPNLGDEEVQLESMPGEESFERVGETSVPIGGATSFPSQFNFGADDTHNWQGRSDERIRLAVMTALHWDLAVPRDRVQVSVARGWVTLTGRVVRDYEKSRAQIDAGAVAGVTGVINKITCESRD